MFLSVKSAMSQPGHQLEKASTTQIHVTNTNSQVSISNKSQHNLLVAMVTSPLQVWGPAHLALYPDLLTPAFVICSTNVGKGLVKVITCNEVPGC